MHLSFDVAIVLLRQRDNAVQRSSPKPPECNRDRFGFAPVAGRRVEADVDSSDPSSDAGALLLRATDRVIGPVGRFAACVNDRRVRGLIEHTLAALVAQRGFGSALEYEDLIDHEH